MARALSQMVCALWQTVPAVPQIGSALWQMVPAVPHKAYARVHTGAARVHNVRADRQPPCAQGQTLCAVFPPPRSPKTPPGRYGNSFEPSETVKYL